MASKKIYIYRGSVTKFGRVVSSFWHGETEAESPKKALNNLKYQYRKQHGLTQSVPIDMPGELELKRNMMYADEITTLNKED